MAMTVVLGTTVSAAPVAGPAAMPAAGPGTGATVNVDGADPGPAFQGIGAISGGGGNSRLLIDYPPGERAQILDYLFSPHFGAALQMLKLEIGGGGFSSDGSEPSVEPAKGQLDCGTGYEFWLAHQALARNPAIKLYGLQWSAPAWVRDPHGGLWSRADVGYVVDWLRCARRNGLAVSYVGGWNEHYLGTGDQQAWFVSLRTALDAAGFTRTRIVAADEAPQMAERPGRVRYSPLLVSQGVADDMVTDPSFGRVVSVLGVHDSCGLPTTGYRCVVAAPARTLAAHTGKQLWESELGATPATGTNPALPGPGGLARALDDAYDQAGITGILVWPLIDAIRRISRTKTGPGLGRPAYETYLAPGRSAWSMVAQTSVAGAAQRITVRVSGGLPARVVHVWSTSLHGAGQFIRHVDIIPDHGAFATLLRPGYVYTFTTTTGQSRAGGRTPPVPVAGPMPIQYSVTADGAGMAKMLAPVDGSFGYVHGVLTQTAAGEPVEWKYPGRSPAPCVIIGENTWRDYTVSARVILPASARGSPPPGAMLIARFQGFRKSAIDHFRGYELRVRGNGSWQVAANGPATVTLASGRVTAARSYTLSLTTRGSVISARINGVLVATVTNRMYRYGPAGLGSLGYYPVRYPSFTVRPQ
jgi:Glycosyl hydrolase family 59